MSLRVGQVWREPYGTYCYVIVKLDATHAYVKRADAPQKVLDNPAGAYAIEREELEAWALQDEVRLLH